MLKRETDFETDCSHKELYSPIVTLRQTNNNKEDPDDIILQDHDDDDDDDDDYDDNQLFSHSEPKNKSNPSGLISQNSSYDLHRSDSSEKSGSLSQNIELDPTVNSSSDYSDDETLKKLTDDEEIQEHLKKKYLASFAYQRELAKILTETPKPFDADKAVYNLGLIKSGTHHRQWLMQQQMREQFGESLTAQIKTDQKVEQYRRKLGHRGKKMLSKLEEDSIEPHYPPWLKFHVRFRKRSADRKWSDYLAVNAKHSGNRRDAVRKNFKSDKYAKENLDIWTNSVTSFVKPGANLQHIVAPVLAKIGLEWRIDLMYTIGCFIGDKRGPNSKLAGVPAESVEILPYASVNELYESNIKDIFVNDNKKGVQDAFPQFYATSTQSHDDSMESASSSLKNTSNLLSASTPTTSNSNNTMNTLFDQLSNQHSRIEQSKINGNYPNTITYVKVPSKSKRYKRRPGIYCRAIESWSPSAVAASLHSLPELAKTLDQVMPVEVAEDLPQNEVDYHDKTAFVKPTKQKGNKIKQKT